MTPSETVPRAESPTVVPPTPTGPPPGASGQALGAFGFALCVTLLSIVNAGWLPATVTNIVVPAALAYGGLGMLLAGVWEFRRGDQFGGVWTTTFGAFWLSLAVLLALVGPGIVARGGVDAYQDGVAAYLLTWGFLIVLLAIPARLTAGALFAAFVLAAVVFVLVALSYLSAPGGLADTLQHVAGYVGLVTGAVGFYAGIALVLNDVTARPVLNLWPYTGR
ncbi:MAG: acetate uptake transporter [Solirubrobacteraceae bacterium]